MPARQSRGRVTKAPTRGEKEPDYLPDAPKSVVFGRDTICPDCAGRGMRAGKICFACKGRRIISRGD